VEARHALRFAPAERGFDVVDWMPGQVLGQLTDNALAYLVVVVATQFAQRVWRCDHNECLEIVGERALAEQIGGFGGKTVLLQLMKIGRLHRAAAGMTMIAIIQHSPALLDRCATITKAVQWIAEAAAAGASLIVFPESFIPGYPSWIWRLAAGKDRAVMGQLHARLLANAVDIGGGDLTELCDAVRVHNVTVVCGINECDRTLGGGTLYNSVVVIGTDGKVQNRHRKLMPTNPERMVHGLGDASGLRVVDTPSGRIGSLICWENYMPLARYALYAQGVEIYVAPTYDSGDAWIGTMCHIAREGRCWVIGSGTVLRGSDIPQDFPARAALFPDPDEWINDGDSVVVDPTGKVVAGPMRRETGILYVEIDVALVAPSRRTLDVAGHYARADIFELRVRRTPAAPVQFVDGEPMRPDVS
jgi:nitrilase